MDYGAKKVTVVGTHIRAPPLYGAVILRSNNFAIAPNIYEIITRAGRNVKYYMTKYQILK